MSNGSEKEQLPPRVLREVPLPSEDEEVPVAPEARPVAPEARPVAPEARPVAPEARFARLCESNSLECTGINPCPWCYVFVFKNVLPSVLRAGNMAATRESAEAALRTYDEQWLNALKARIEEVSVSSEQAVPFMTPLLAEFLLFKETRQKFLAAKAAGSHVAESVHASLPEKLVPSQATRNAGSNGAAAHSNKSRRLAPQNAGEPGTKPVRGEVKQIATKVAKESLAPAKSHSANRNGDSEVDPAVGGASPAVGGTPATPGLGRH